MNNKFEACDECGSAFDPKCGYTAIENDFMEIDAELVKEKIGTKLCFSACAISFFTHAESEAIS